MSLVTLPNLGPDPFTVNASVLNGKVDPLATDYNGNIQNVNIASGAGIVYSKLTLTDSIVNADINSSAAIVDTKLSAITTAGKVAGSAITLASTSIVTAVGSDYVLIADTSDSGLPKKALASDLINTFTPSASNALSGSVIQVQYQLNVTKTTGTTAIPLDDTIPQNTEGDEYLTKAITPNHASNILRIDVVMYGDASAGGTMQMALFQDSTAGALSAVGKTISGGNLNGPMVLTHFMAAGTTSATTFKVRAGGTSGTFTINGYGGNRIYGGVLGSSICITEIKA